jgi:signal transduction histidine kinase
MKSHYSVTRGAYFRLLKLSLTFTSIIIAVFILISPLFYRSFKETETNNAIVTILNDAENFRFKKSPDIILKKIGSIPGVAEVSIYDEACRSLGFSSLSISYPVCPFQKSFSSVSTQLGARKVIIFYELKIDLSDNYEMFLIILLVVSLIVFATSALGLYYFLVQSLLKPISILEMNIEEDREIEFPREFTFISTKLASLKKQISNHERRVAYFAVAKRVLHDIRNPLYHLELLSETDSIKSEDVKERVLEINYQISKILNQKSNESFSPLMSSVQNISRDIEFVYRLRIELENEVPDLRIEINDSDLKNILFNMARNSQEANCSKLIFSFGVVGDSINFYVKDDGDGFSETAISKVFKQNFTTKTDGNGIGLAGIKNDLAEKGCDLTLEKSDLNGTIFLIKLLTKRYPSRIVYIDDDKYLRHAWFDKGKKVNIEVLAFDSIEKFLEISDSLPKDTPVYVDSNLGNSILGEVESKKIHHNGFTNISLATSMDELDVSNFPWIKRIQNKTFPF